MVSINKPATQVGITTFPFASSARDPRTVNHSSTLSVSLKAGGVQSSRMYCKLFPIKTALPCSQLKGPGEGTPFLKKIFIIAKRTILLTTTCRLCSGLQSVLSRLNQQDPWGTGTLSPLTNKGPRVGRRRSFSQTRRALASWTHGQITHHTSRAFGASY